MIAHNPETHFNDDSRLSTRWSLSCGPHSRVQHVESKQDGRAMRFDSTKPSCIECGVMNLYVGCRIQPKLLRCSRDKLLLLAGPRGACMQVRMCMHASAFRVEV